MKIASHAICVSILFQFVAVSQDFPSDVTDVLQKLQQFEMETQEKADLAISKKKMAVVTFLERVLERETKAGNLEQAVAIKSKIDELTPSPSTEVTATQTPENVGVPKSKREFEKWLATVEFVVSADGRLTRRYDNGTIVTLKEGKPIGAASASIDGNRISWIYGADKKTEFSITVESLEQATMDEQTRAFESKIQPRANLNR